MTQPSARCLILACGNTLRSDDGVGPWLASWAEDKFQDDPRIRIIARQQWTPDLAEDIAQVEAVLFVDCSLASAPGAVRIDEVGPSSPMRGVATHHQSAAELLALTRQLYDSQPRQALLLTVGVGSTAFGESFSEEIAAVLHKACEALEETVSRLLREEFQAG
jgi:hydrogenase maturation protease